MIDESLKSIVQQYLKNLRQSGIEANFAVLFGSNVLGKTGKWSDIDVVIIAPEFDPPKTEELINTLWRATLVADNRIEPIPCGEKVNFLASQTV